MSHFDINERLISLDKKAMEKVTPYFDEIERVAEYNSRKVLSAFIHNKVSEAHLSASTGYGYGDIGRDTLDKIVAECFGAEDALIRHSFASGTHTLSVALFGILRPGDKVLVITGRPYDTIIGVFGIDKKTDGSLADFGVEYAQVDLNDKGKPDKGAITAKIESDFYKMVYIQRSKGYSLRPSLSVKEIGELCDIIKKHSPDSVIMVDNCYGEFVEETEPTEAGADIIAGSLIKNPGGGIAPCGGYIAGKKKYIEMCANRMTCAGVGREVGATLGHNRELYMGFFSAPHVVGEALKTAVFTSALFEMLGYKCLPGYKEKRADIIETVILKTPEALISFCKGLQSGSPIDSFVVPEPWDMPGYTDKIIMAAGAFTLGASIELSADGPLREPFAAWLQGGLNFHTAKVGILLAANAMINEGII